MSTAIFRRVARASTLRNFSTTTVARKDLVQDLYLKEIKAYKPAPVAKDAHVGVVKAYTLPPAPAAPSLPSDFASELSAYDASEPEIATVEHKTTEPVAAAAGAGATAFLDFLEADLPKPEHHH